MKVGESDLQRLTLAMENKNWSIEEVIKFIENGPIRSQKIIDTASDIKLNIDYTKTIEQAVADGKYDWKNSDVTTKNFPVPLKMTGKKVEVSVKLFHFNRDISSEDAISKMDKAGYRPATLMELLALGFLFPELQRQFPIVALGSVWRVANLDLYAPGLFVGGHKRGLDLRWIVSGWRARYRFLGVHK
jgi:hypothetical protein